jgi:hypothetical protein
MMTDKTIPQFEKQGLPGMYCTVGAILQDQMMITMMMIRCVNIAVCFVRQARVRVRVSSVKRPSFAKREGIVAHHPSHAACITSPFSSALAFQEFHKTESTVVHVRVDYLAAISYLFHLHPSHHLQEEEEEEVKWSSSLPQQPQHHHLGTGEQSLGAFRWRPFVVRLIGRT